MMLIFSLLLISLSTLCCCAEKQPKDLGSLIIFDHCPEYHCKGRGCERIRERNGCYVCACKIGAKGRGCDKMPAVLRREIIENQCPNVTHPDSPPYQPQMVMRWYRHIDPATSTDACSTYMYPLCFDIDHNLWNAPRWKSECDFHCYPERDPDTILEPGVEPVVLPDGSYSHETGLML